MAKRNKLPFDEVKIGYIKAKVNAVRGRDAEKREIFGEFFSKQHEIDYDEDMVDSEIANTLIHEILHGITHVFGVKFRDSEQEEDVVNSFGGGLATLFQDNKELLVWLLETFHPEDE
jgi:hypothetical protein